MVGRLEPVLRATRSVGGWARLGVAMSAVSAVAAEPLQRIVASAGTVKVLSNGIDVDRWSLPPGHRQADRSQGPVRVVSAMRLAARKRPMSLLRIMARVRALVPGHIAIRLDIFGDGPDRGRLERFVATHDMAGWVALPGRVSREDLRGRYAASDIFVAPAHLESFGIAALEARTVGLPVVGRHASGVQEFVKDGLNGYLVTDDEAMASALARLVVDNGLRQSMTAYNRNTPPEQTWERILDGAEAEYRRAIAATSAATSSRATTPARPGATKESAT
jgi:glycosyltransferase involved in cell wall biosynthesis